MFNFYCASVLVSRGQSNTTIINDVYSFCSNDGWTSHCIQVSINFADYGELMLNSYEKATEMVKTYGNLHAV